jgi:dimethylhistidine N-methyltransferase
MSPTEISEKPRLQFREVPPSHPMFTLEEAVVQGFSQEQKVLYPMFFYDKRGSELFEDICGLPEYYVTRTEQGILEKYADEMIAEMGSELEIVEFGSGSSIKTRLMLDAALRNQDELRYTPIDISGEFLRECCHDLLEDYDRLHICGIAAEYRDALHHLPKPEAPRLMVFLGGNLGNMHPTEAADLLREVEEAMGPHDRFLLGLDQVKDPEVIEAAYNDAQGVTAQFNKNILHRIKNELDSDVDPGKFKHHAPFVPEEHRVEMRLVSQEAQTVHVDGHQFAFEKDEFIRTEVSTKYTPEILAEMAAIAEMKVLQTWKDDNNWFHLNLLCREDA